jgi:ABC-2 type transport system permease protein
MRLFPPGSLSWLLAHEFTLFARTVAARGRWGMILILSLLAVLTVTVGIPLAHWLEHVPFGPEPMFNAVVFAVTVFVFTLLLSQALSMTVMVFFDRGDFDLILSSPIDPARVLFVRSFAIAAAPMLLYFAFVTPFVLPLAILVRWQMLAAYGVLAALALVGASIGLMLAMVLFAFLGARRTKTFGQMLAALLGAAIFLVSQIPTLLPGSGRSLALDIIATIRSGLFAPSSPLSWPALAVYGEPGPLFGFLVVSFALFWLTARFLGARFAADAALASGADIGRRRSRDPSPLKGFGGNRKVAMVRKELLLIARDPALISQVLLRVFYFLPLALLLMNNSLFGDKGHMMVAGTAGAVVFFVSQIADSLTWIVLSAEGAPDLIKSAPVSAGEARRAKLLAAVGPVLLLAAIPVLFLCVTKPWAGIVTAVGVAISAAAACYVNLWYEKPQPRKNFLRRGQGSIITTLGVFLFSLLMLMATTSAVVGGFPYLMASGLTLVLAVGLLGLLYLCRRRDD